MSLAPIPEAVLAEMAAVGPTWVTNVAGNVRRMVELFSPVLAQTSKHGISCARNEAYGQDPRQILDVYHSSGKAGNAPVVLFFHGGAFVDGNKDRSPEIYSNVLNYLASSGVVGVNVEYRLAPQAVYPSGVEDVGLAVQWASKNIQRFGGDPSRLFLMGHSAGAAHTSGYAYGPGSAVRGHIVVSGRVRADAWPGNPNAKKVVAYYGSDDPEVLSARSPVNLVGPLSPPTMVAIAEFENPFLDVHCAELFYRVSLAKGRADRFVRLSGHNHTSIIASLNTADDRLGGEIVAFIRGLS